ncbi:MAG: zinc ribbon domain-containing protein [Gordonia sp. (in: high G+C Gram-positive bacteria)]|uniref:FmdB family zinc ribbon protein n=1 Tax=Gordonia sp. (in: high G+C Gram-positive bacteria) TaxID=84139 RepID=UPI0039E6BD44
MPTYSYACTKCDNKFDIVQSFSDDALTECPECKGKLRKLFNSVGIVFKGSGFYRTDSRAGSVKADSGDSGSSSGEKSSSSEKSSSTEKSSSKSKSADKSSSKSSGSTKSA